MRVTTIPPLALACSAILIGAAALAGAALGGTAAAAATRADAATFTVAPLAVAPFAPPPDVGTLLNANYTASGGPAFARRGALRLVYDYSGQGMTGTLRSRFDLRSGHFVDESVIGPTRGANGFDGRSAWMQDMSGAVTPQAGGDTLQLAVNEAYRDANLWWRADRGGAVIASLGLKSEGVRRFDVLSVEPRGGKRFEAWLDHDTHLLDRIVEMQSFETITTFFSDYRRISATDGTTSTGNSAAPTGNSAASTGSSASQPGGGASQPGGAAARIGDATPRAAEGPLLAGKVVIDDGNGAQYRQTATLSRAQFAKAEPAGAYAAPQVHLTDARIDAASGHTTVPFELINNHIYAKVRINGKGPFLCIFDTGGHNLLTPETAKALAVHSEGQSAGTGAGEGVVDTSFARGVSFRIGDLVIENQTISVLPFATKTTEGVDEQGMIGFEVFRRFVTRIDYGKRTLTFTDPARFNAADAGVPIPFVFYSHLPQVAGTFEGLHGQFDIDTGSRVEVTLTKPFVEANGLLAKHPKGVTAVDGWGVGGRARSYVTRGTNLTLGTVSTDGVVASFATQDKGAFSDPSYQGNIGSGFLKRFVVTLDYDHRIMYLKPLPPPVPDTATFDRAGLWVNVSEPGFEVVDLTQGGPAQAAGLKVGDHIMSIDGAPSNTITLSDLRRRLRDDPPGTRLALGLAGTTPARESASAAPAPGSAGSSPARILTLTLQDQI